MTKSNKQEEDIIEEEESTGSKVIGLIRSICVYLLAICIVAGAILFATNQSPTKSLFGYRYYTVLTPSMQPTYKVGDMVIVKVTGIENVAVGDVVTFHPSQDSDVYLTHRITQIIEDYEGTGVACFTTKGDANEDDDGFLIDEGRLVGKVTFGIPKLGYVIRFIQLRWYFVIPLVVLIFVFFEVLDRYFEGEEDEEEEA